MNAAGNTEFELAHVLFMDVVGYSRLLLEEQREVLRELNAIVRGTEQFRSANASSQLVCLPTGDGMVLAFFSTPEAPVRCAIEVARALPENPQLRVRMGIHSGPVNRVADVNESANVAGAGINMAQRVMDCGDAGHILVSRHVAEDLAESREWKNYLHDLGECEVKHSLRIHLFNFYGDGVGNPAVPPKFKSSQPVSAATNKKWIWIGLAALVLIIAALLLRTVRIDHRTFSKNTSDEQKPGGSAAAPIPEKSIAVLPFENLSDDKGNVYFVDGIQDEILTRLAKVADLKVISRTSTQRFRSKPEDLPDIAKKLNVAHIVEGSVQRFADQVRVNVQLIKAGSDAHLWAETYDRKLTDVFVVETEIATKIADSLQAKVTGTEHAAMAARPTENMEAHELYLKGRFFAAKRTGDDLKRAIDYYNQALAKDPNYAAAYAGISTSYSLLKEYSNLTAAEVFPKARAAAEKAVELDPNLAEAHAALALVLRSADFDFRGARKEFERAIELNPNSADSHYFFAVSVLAPLGQFDESIVQIKRALSLDPLSNIMSVNLGHNYMLARRYPEAISQLKNSIEIEPNFSMTHGILGIALLLNGEVQSAIKEYQTAISLGKESHSAMDGAIATAFLANAYGLSGQKEKAIETNKEFEETKRQLGATLRYPTAIAQIGLGNKDAAIDALEKGFQELEGGEGIDYIKVDPMLDPLRGNPRFEALANKIIPPDVK